MAGNTTPPNSTSTPSTPEASTNGSPERGAEQVLGKLGELHRYLLVRSKAPRDSKSDIAVTQNSVRIADELFRRAPEDFLRRTSLQTMAQIAAEAATVHEHFLQASAPFEVVIGSHPATDERRRFTSIVSAMSDRPFIVDTISEFLRSEHHIVHVFLHPVLHEGSRRISLVYIEIDALEESRAIVELRERLEQLLHNLVRVTHDFSAMLGSAQKTAQLFLDAADGNQSEVEHREISEFLKWLADGGFVFLGARSWQNSSVSNGDPGPAIVAAEDLGLFRSQDAELKQALADTTRDARYMFEHNNLFQFSKVFLESPIHRRQRMDIAVVRLPGQPIVQAFLGLLTSKAVAQEASSVPIIRQKLRRIVSLEGAVTNSHDHKEIVSIFDSTPKSQLLRYSVDSLRRDIQLILGIQGRRDTRVSLTVDSLQRFVTVMVVMPRDKFSQEIRERIQHYLEQEIGITAGASEYRLSFTEEPYIRLNLYVTNPRPGQLLLDTPRLEQEIQHLALSWEERVHELLTEKLGKAVAQRLADYYSRTLPEDYVASQSPEEAAADIASLEQLSADNPIEVRINPLVNRSERYDIRIYKRAAGLSLSQLVPLLEHTGITVENEYTTHLGEQQTAWAAIYSLYVTPRVLDDLPKHLLEETLIPGLKLILKGLAESDRLNALMITPGLDHREIALLRTIVRYLWQIRAVSSLDAAMTALTSNPGIALACFDYFDARFNPTRFSNLADRQKMLSDLDQSFVLALKEVKDLGQDRILRSIKNALEAIVRTNFYRDNNGVDISVKIDCQLIARMPNPRPRFEIFVSSPDFCGVHLRGGKVARGGLRWSDRHEDFRTEVLGLMKTQMVKNAIIVPVGAKGGFVISQRFVEVTPEVVSNCYRRFIRSLLEVTDNLATDGSIIPPKNVVVHDEPDPYLVVAADKGTATFSDLANEIATTDFDFWLGDAFASGGSKGYDHKKLAITARGGWECVKRHFAELGLDIQVQPFTAVGIGDMSGDVFGNGMLLSNTLKLVAAFNHKHIFIDPDPDPKVSFEERKRLFTTPRTQWSDYNPALISPGGGVYLRSQKEITLDPRVCEVLGITSSSLSGEELVRAILLAPVDLLWNGGIGTYVKASYEDNVNVGDRANDDVRVDANQVRARVIGEGGNLGFTQLGRIEFAQSGGHINTDAIDNSGGVDMSDHEVNLKILLRTPVQRGTITASERDTILAGLSDEVSAEVLEHNYSQSVALSLGVRRTKQRLAFHHNVIESLEKAFGFKRAGEGLPTAEEFNERRRTRAGLTRPELAVIAAYVKRHVSETVIASDLPDGEFAEGYLFDYFPKAVASRFREEVVRHPLRREIIAAQIANTLVDRMGTVFIHRACNESGALPANVVASFVIANAVLDGDTIFTELRTMDRPGSTDTFLRTTLALSRVFDGVARWLLDRRPPTVAWSELLIRYGGSVRELLDATPSLLPATEKVMYDRTCVQLTDSGFRSNLAARIASFAYVSSYFDATEISTVTSAPLIDTARTYLQVASTLQINRLLENATTTEVLDPWEEAALRSVSASLRSVMRGITRDIIEESGAATPAALEKFMEKRAHLVERFQRSLSDFEQRPIPLAALLVLSQQLALLSSQR